MRKYIFIIILLSLVSCQTIKNNKKESNLSNIKSLAQLYLKGNYNLVISIIDNYYHYNFIYYSNQDSDKIQNSLLHYLKALCLIKQGQYSYGLKEFEKSKEYIPIKIESELFYNIGVTYFYLGNFKKAEEYFQKSLNIYYNEDIYNYLLLLKNDPKILNSTLIPISGDVSINQAQGWLCYYLGDYTSAIYHFKKMIEVKPDFVMGYISLGIVYDTINNYNSALEYYKKGLEIDKSYPDLWNNLGILYYNLNKYKDSEDAFYKAIELNNNYPYPYSNLGFYYLENDELNKAELKFIESIKVNSSDLFLLGESYAGLAIVNFQKGDKNKSVEYKNISLKYNYKLDNILYLKNELKWKEKIINYYINIIK